MLVRGERTPGALILGNQSDPGRFSSGSACTGRRVGSGKRLWRLAAPTGIVLLLVLTLPASFGHPSGRTGPYVYGTTVTSHGFPAWMNVDRISVQKQTNFIFEFTVGANIPSKPSLLGYPLVDWQIALDTNNTTAATGWPFDSSTVSPPEYAVYLWWDGHHFAAGVANRTPLQHGGQVVITTIPYSTSGDQIRFSVPASRLGNPSTMGFLGFTEAWVHANARIVSPTKVVALPGSLSNFSQNNPVAPFLHHGGVNCAYTDSYFYGPNPTDCWALWTFAKDHHSAVVALGPPGYTDLLSTSVTGGFGVFSVSIRLMGDMPASPQLDGNPIFVWVMGFDTNQSAAPIGWPLDAAFGHDASDYWWALWWDGAHFASMIINRTPMLTGGAPVTTTQKLHVDDNIISFSFPAARIGNSTGFGFATTDGWLGHSPIKIESPTDYTRLHGTSDITYQPTYEAIAPLCSYPVLPPAVSECYTLWP
jgi:hypothetical protein